MLLLMAGIPLDNILLKTQGVFLAEEGFETSARIRLATGKDLLKSWSAKCAIPFWAETDTEWEERVFESTTYFERGGVSVCP